MVTDAGRLGSSTAAEPHVLSLMDPITRNTCSCFSNLYAWKLFQQR